MLKTQNLVKAMAPWAFKAYIVWSICADIIAVSAIFWYVFS